MPRNRLELRIKDYHKSISLEFNIIKDRVRYLIGDSHWGEDGRYKEIILMNVLKKYLPKNFSVGTGFIMNNDDYESISTQIDIIIYENTYPILFKEGDFVVVNSANVVGVIEVKSKFDNSRFESVIKKSEEIGQLINRRIFNGIFYYESNQGVYFEEEEINLNFRNVLQNTVGKVNHIAIGENQFIKFWEEGNPSLNNGNPCMSLYELSNLSFSYFITNCIEITYLLSKDYQDNTDNLGWFLYPIEGTKETQRKNNIEITIR
ncbi:DUF6602 domain-containing protein [Clostridium formicaceticum]|uniref:DUF6602 domain-containing protein n=1 Tax=Clostridium formicaceticum TaxID=1497 RepID=A0AAC9RQD4_9CLOT|nr:DUF6602 domain-containing protein [Clostridium formicaceticum]AOY75359.1 hypothetical protein BJL90_05270 [Clostridium formicaceticum]ARE89814.1 hypothetical protein CLFO_42970 [Clostridium formicaceticum]